jgi:ribosomal protein S18 acetylase RimI-like enzyme
MFDPPIAVRRLQPEDVAAYRAIRLEALERHPEAFGSTLEAESAKPLDWFAERLGRNAVFGAFRQSDLIGVAGFFAFTGAKERHKGVLWGMYVRESERGTGAGKALVEAVIQHASEHVELLQLSVVRDNHAARRLYAALGFTEYGIEEHALKQGADYFDEVLMVKSLTPDLPSPPEETE